MKFKTNNPYRAWIHNTPILILFLIGLWLVVLKPLGPNLSLLPGDLGDGRFNNYILEHFVRWVSGLDTGFWNAPFFYPFPNVIAFSDNLLGSAPFYAVFRWVGLDRETAFQGWYILSFFLNYAAAAFAIKRFKIKPWSAAFGAFFFTFGLPLLAQENHVQLIYRFCIPVVCFLLWQFFHQPRLTTLAWIIFGTVWQLFISVYLGIFLLMLLVVMTILLPFFYTSPRKWGQLYRWPDQLRLAWIQSSLLQRLTTLLFALGSGCAAVFLMLPYLEVTRNFGFFRGWDEVLLTLPKWQSYLLADHSLIWGWVTHQGTMLAKWMGSFPLRGEHQLFPGFAILILLVISPLILARSDPQNRRTAYFYLMAVLVLILFTLNWGDFSLYRVFWKLPGMKSVRAVTRIQLVLMFPLSVYVSCVLNSLEKRPSLSFPWRQTGILLVTALLISESIFYSHSTISKADAQARLTALRSQIPAAIPDQPVLLVASNNAEPFYMRELDAMLLAQDLGWPTMNGYSGNVPPGFKLTESCAQIPERITSYMQFARIAEKTYSHNFIQRVVPVGFKDCVLVETP